MKKCLGWPLEPPFYVPEDVRRLFSEVRARGQQAHKQWVEMFERYREDDPASAELWDMMQSRWVPKDMADRLLASVDAGRDAATREAGGAALQEAARLVPGLCGGAADLAPSTKTYIKDAAPLGKGDFSGRNFHFGVREHGMGGILNGLALYGGLIPYGSTFLVFSDYMRPAIRLAALNRIQVVYVFTHDSVFLGEDGPTHQPIEQLASLRAMPGLTVIRPADAAETAVAWAVALANQDGPTALALSRQKLPPTNKDNPAAAKGLEKGGYVVSDAPGGKIDAILIATGSEVHLALGAQRMLAEEGISCRVVSMPSFELFDQQPRDYQECVLPPGVAARVAIEAATTFGWRQYVGDRGIVIGIDHFGASAPAAVLAHQFGFTPEAIAARVKRYLGRGCC
jgi:transketolase